MGRSPCCDKLGLKKGPWTPEEDQKLLAFIEEHGHGNWRALPTKAGLQRCGKSCRLRWTNYLRPDIKRGKFSLQEEQTIIQLHALLGNRWSAIATHLPKRTDNEIKNYWNTHLKKRLTKMGIDPVTHKPKNDALVSGTGGGGGGGGGVPQSKNASHLSHMAQWESARLEAEARLVRQSKLRFSSNNNNSNNNNNNNNSLFGSQSPDIQISDHNQIVPSLSPTRHSHHYFNMAATDNAATTTTTTTPRCLDVLKAWQGELPSTSTSVNNNNNEGILGIGVGMTRLSGGVGVPIESPTSTLSFSENTPSAAPTMGTGAVIEFMGHQDDHHHHHHQEIIKKEEQYHHHHHHGHDDEWKRGYDDHHHNNEIEFNPSLSFNPSPSSFDHDINGLTIDHHATQHINNGDKDDHEEEDEDHEQSQVFMEGFTELLLSTKTSDVSSSEKTYQEDENNIGKAGTTSSSSGGSDYYEDNKTYWNNILNLVNSSPSHSPMF